MQPYPHVYTVTACGGPSGRVPVSAERVPTLDTAPPAEFDGPGDAWSPEALLCAAVADCLVLTFRAVARASKFEWLELSCRTQATLDRTQGGTRFTRFTSYATLKLPAGGDGAKARLLLEKSEHSCLVANSLNGERVLHIEVSHAA
ncbi:MAG: OsmC family protein [Gammaproteobacteria bacterium]|nr:OsmC family protein [Gammaproteobacteria bacterium]